MSVSTRSVASALAERVGSARVSADPGRLAAAAIDGRTPRWIVNPESAEQVAGVLALAHDEALAVVPRGSGSALELGHPPTRCDVVLDLRGLARILDDNPDDLTVSVEAGITAGALAARLGSRRQWLPVDPPAGATRTLGGLVATNASGPLRARFGTLRDLLLGVRFVQADGVVTWGGARVVKSVTGYDVPKLMVGALGTLGVLAELALRLHPMPEHESTWVVTFGASEAAHAFVARVLDGTLQPARFEVLNESALRAVNVRPARVAVALAIGSVEAAVRDQGALVEDIARRTGGHIAPVDDGFWERFARALATPAGGVLLKVASLPSRLAQTLDAIESGAGGWAAAPIVAGCAAVATLRVLLQDAGVEAIAELVAQLRALVGEFGGSVVIEAGPPALRARVDPWGPVETDAFALMRDLKHAFDPRGVLNPGRFVGGL